TESAPPETPIRTVSPPASIAWRRMVRSAAWTRSTGSAALQADPHLAVLEVLLLPHGDGALERVDRVATGLEGVAAVRGGHGDQHGRFADLEPADTMQHGDAAHAGPASADGGADLPHLGLGHRGVRFVLEKLPRPAIGLVAHDAGEDDDAAGAGIVDLRRDRVGRQRKLTEGDDVHHTPSWRQRHHSIRVSFA